jgi:hypothetical protein
VDEFEERILTACKTDRALPDPDSRFQEGRPLRQPIWHKAAREWTEYGAEEIKVEFRPTPQQVEDWGIVMPWCATLDKKDFRIIWLRSRGLFFTEIADRMLAWGTRLSHDTAQRRFDRAIQRLYALSGQKPATSLKSTGKATLAADRSRRRYGPTGKHRWRAAKSPSADTILRRYGE